MIDVQNLNKTYDRRRIGENHVLHDISLSLPNTGFVCILGPSGCGKTSLLNAIGGLDDFDNGRISVGDVSVDRSGTALYEAERNRNFGYIFQNYYLLPEHSVGYNVYLGLHSLKLTHSQKLRRVQQALKAVEMDRYIRRNVGELSGGQQQRVAIARALARKPRVIFADEPTGNLDEANTMNICSLLRRISKNSLVIMVTHEERIAQFFADRIITLENGRLKQDSGSWERSCLELGTGKVLYTGDYTENRLDTDQVSLRFYSQEGTEPVQISVVALKDRIVIKLNDHRAVSCGTSTDFPALVEGERPRYSLEEMDRHNQADDFLGTTDDNIPGKPGTGITFGDIFREAQHISRGKKLRGLGSRLFLILLTVLLAWTVADFITLSTIEPEDFITTHSQMLEVIITRGPHAGSSIDTLQEKARIYKTALAESDIDMIIAPDVSYVGTISGNPILQASKLSVEIKNCSYVPLTYWDEGTLILGRAPENALEVVMDRWVLDAIMAQDGVAQNSLKGMEHFLGKQIHYGSLKAAPTVVGICDSGQPAIYLSAEMLASIGASGTEAMSLSTFQALYPGLYDDLELAEGECIVLPNNAGEIFWDRLGSSFKTTCGSYFNIVALCDSTECYAKIIVADSQIDDLMLNMALRDFWVYCDDKEAVTQQLLQMAKKYESTITVTVVDAYSDQMAAYQEASAMQADARSIIMLTIMVLSAVMLYLLRRADVHSRIGMLSVYRLLGIPKRKAVAVFALESLLNGLTTVVPVTALFWAVLQILRERGSLDLLFPWYAAVAVALGILAFQFLVTILPLYRLLKLPPARLAAKYDF